MQSIPKPFCKTPSWVLSAYSLQITVSSVLLFPPVNYFPNIELLSKHYDQTADDKGNNYSSELMPFLSKKFFRRDFDSGSGAGQSLLY